jgi:ankyrin repeat protein
METEDDLGRSGNLELIKFFMETFPDIMLDKIMDGAASKGHIDIVKYLTEKGGELLMYDMWDVVRNGHYDIFRYSIDRQGLVIDDRLLDELSETSDIRIIKLFLDAGRKFHTATFYSVGEDGKTDVLEWMFNNMPEEDRNLDVYESVIEGASLGGHLDIIDWMLSLGAKNYQTCCENAASRGHYLIVKKFLDLGITDYNSVFQNGVIGENMEVLRLLVDRGFNFNRTVFKHSMLDAIINGNLTIVKFIDDLVGKDFDASTFDSAMRWASRNGNIHIVKYMVARGATNYNLAMDGACGSGEVEIIQLLIDHGANHF